MRKISLVILHLISCSIGSLAWADEPCQSVAEMELARLELGSFDHPEANTSKNRQGATILGTGQQIIGNMTTFVAMKPSGFSQAIRMVEYFKFGSKSESGEFPFMFLSDGAQTRYLDHRSSVTDHDPILIYVNSGDKFEHTALGTILLIVNKDCRVVKATLDNANGIEANAENCKAAPPGKEWKNGILNTLCERYFQWAKEVKSVGSTLENRPIIAPTARKVSATPAR